MQVESHEWNSLPWSMEADCLDADQNMPGQLTATALPRRHCTLCARARLASPANQRARRSGVTAQTPFATTAHQQTSERSHQDLIQSNQSPAAFDPRL